MKIILATMIVLITMLAGWQLLAVVGHLPPYILPTPYEVMVALTTQQTILLTHTLTTLTEILLGFTLGIILGIFAAVIIAFHRYLGFWFLPILIISQAVPTFAIAPLIVIWLGFGLASKVATTALMIFFPIVSSFYDGLRQTPIGYLDIAQIHRASKWRSFLYLRIPAALPSLASGIRIAAVVAPVGAIVGEWVGSSHGLGYLMLNANARMQIDVMFAVLIVIIALSLLLYFFTDALLRRLIWWE